MRASFTQSCEAPKPPVSEYGSMISSPSLSLYKYNALPPAFNINLHLQMKCDFTMDIFSTIGTILALVLTLICIAQSHIWLSKVPQSVPWAGVRIEILSKLRACLRELNPRSPASKAGYEKVFDPPIDKLGLLTALVDSSVEKACPMHFRILDFALWSWFLRNM